MPDLLPIKTAAVSTDNPGGENAATAVTASDCFPAFQFGLHLFKFFRRDNRFMVMLPKILSGKYKISHENVIMLARMDAASVQRLESRLEAREDSTAFVPFSISREQINDCFPHRRKG